MARNGPRIAIIGGGFSGTLLAVHLLRRCPAVDQVYLIEKNSGFGRGLAYSTPNASHLLNVPAGRMSAFSDQPDDLLEWLRQQPASDGFDPATVGPRTFIPRRLFGAYVQHLLGDELWHGSGRRRLRLINDAAVDIRPSGSRVEVVLDGGHGRRVDAVVLAVGNFPPAPPVVGENSFYDSVIYRSDPWAPDAVADLEKTAPVLLIGTGLTMVDVVMTLLARGHRGPIHALSRRGQLPHRHNLDAGRWTFTGPPPTGSIAALTLFMRREVRRAADAGIGWHAVVDALRPLTQEIWAAAPVTEQRRFLRHLRPWWDVHRHRLPPAVADQIAAARASGQLTIGGGWIRGYHVAEGRVTVTYRPRGRSQPATLIANRVINCSGPNSDYARIADPLLRSLLAAGAMRPDPLALGLDIGPNARVMAADGAPGPKLYAIGPVTRGKLWEIIAVPDIRRQCEELAHHLAAEMVQIGIRHASAGKRRGFANVAADI